MLWNGIVNCIIPTLFQTIGVIFLFLSLLSFTLLFVLLNRSKSGSNVKNMMTKPLISSLYDYDPFGLSKNLTNTNPTSSSICFAKCVLISSTLRIFLAHHRSTQLFEKLKTSKKSSFFAIKNNVNVSSKNPTSLPTLTILAHDLSSLHLLRSSATPIFLHSLIQPVARMLCHNHFYLHTQFFRKIPVIQLLVGAVTKLVIIQQSVL